MSTGFHPLRILNVVPETSDAAAIYLQPDDNARALFAFKPGQHLTLRAMIGGEDLRRTYSLCSRPDEDVLRIGIKRIPGGRFSSWALENLRAGSTIESMTPRGHFTWPFERDAGRSYVAFAGGSGITPVLSLLKTCLVAEPMSTFTLLYGNRSSDTIMFLEEISALKDRHIGRLQVCHFLEAEDDEVALFNGRLDEERVTEVLTKLVEPSRIDAAFICGPGPMMDGAERALRAAGVPPAAVLLERFSAGSPIPLVRTPVLGEAARQGIEFIVAIEGRRRRVVFDPDHANLLESAAAARLPAPFACKAGVCATCRAKLVAGEVTMDVNYGLGEEELAAGYILTCQARPLGPGVEIDYDA